MAYKLNVSGDSCYPNTSVLINKFDIRNEKELAEAEAAITGSAAAKLLSMPLALDFGFKDYKQIHCALFSELYEWAGQTRTIPLSKMTTVFVQPDKIEELGGRIFARIKAENYFTGLKRSNFIDEMTDLYDSLNRLHPFREGNGRTQRVFFTQLIRNAGYDIDYSSMNSELLILGSIQASGGVSDVLRQFFDENVRTDV